MWLGCRRGTEARVIDRAAGEGVEHIEVFEFRGGAVPRPDAADVRRLLAWLPRVDVVHVHRGKEHWLAAVANRLSGTPPPLVRTRHIVQAVRPHAANRWLYRRATALVHTVSEAIRQQYIAGGLVAPIAWWRSRRRRRARATRRRCPIRTCGPAWARTARRCSWASSRASAS